MTAKNAKPAKRPKTALQASVENMKALPLVDPEPLKPWTPKGTGPTPVHVWNLLTECVTFGEDAATLAKVCGYNPLRTREGEYLVSFPFACWATAFRLCEAKGYRLGVAEYIPDSPRVRQLIEECKAEETR